MKIIPLNNKNKKKNQLVCYFTIVDDHDYDRLSKYSWLVSKRKHGNYYAFKHKENQYMHRFLFNLSKGNKFIVDHINGNGLDNRKENIRICNYVQNEGNSKKKGGTSKYKGVYLNKQTNKWVAQIGSNYKIKNLGSFDSQEKAAHFYNEAAIQYFGSFAKLNTIIHEEFV